MNTQNWYLSQQTPFVPAFDIQINVPQIFLPDYLNAKREMVARNLLHHVQKHATVSPLRMFLFNQIIQNNTFNKDFEDLFEQTCYTTASLFENSNARSDVELLEECYDLACIQLMGYFYYGGTILQNVYKANSQELNALAEAYKRYNHIQSFARKRQQLIQANQISKQQEIAMNYQNQQMYPNQMQPMYPNQMQPQMGYVNQPQQQMYQPQMQQMHPQMQQQMMQQQQMQMHQQQMRNQQMGQYPNQQMGYVNAPQIQQQMYQPQMQPQMGMYPQEARGEMKFVGQGREYGRDRAPAQYPNQMPRQQYDQQNQYHSNRNVVNQQSNVNPLNQPFNDSYQTAPVKPHWTQNLNKEEVVETPVVKEVIPAYQQIRNLVTPDKQFDGFPNRISDYGRDLNELEYLGEGEKYVYYKYDGSLRWITNDEQFCRPLYNPKEQYLVYAINKQTGNLIIVVRDMDFEEHKTSATIAHGRRLAQIQENKAVAVEEKEELTKYHLEKEDVEVKVIDLPLVHESETTLQTIHDIQVDKVQKDYKGNKALAVVTKQKLATVEECGTIYYNLKDIFNKSTTLTGVYHELNNLYNSRLGKDIDVLTDINIKITKEVNKTLKHRLQTVFSIENFLTDYLDALDALKEYPAVFIQKLDGEVEKIKQLIFGIDVPETEVIYKRLYSQFKGLLESSNGSVDTKTTPDQLSSVFDVLKDSEEVELESVVKDISIEEIKEKLIDIGIFVNVQSITLVTMDVDDIDMLNALSEDTTLSLDIPINKTVVQVNEVAKRLLINKINNLTKLTGDDIVSIELNTGLIDTNNRILFKF